MPLEVIFHQEELPFLFDSLHTLELIAFSFVHHIQVILEMSRKSSKFPSQFTEQNGTLSRTNPNQMSAAEGKSKESQ